MFSVKAAARFAGLAYFCVFLVQSEKYVPVRVEIETNDGGVPPKVFTAEEIAKYDASDVS